MQTPEQWKGSKGWKTVAGVAAAATLGIGAMAVASPGRAPTPEGITLSDVTTTSVFAGEIAPNLDKSTTFEIWRYFDHDSPFDDSDDSPSMDSPSMDSPSMDSPSMDSPSMDSPSMDSPSMDSPSMDSPSMDSPSMDSPSMDDFDDSDDSDDSDDFDDSDDSDDSNDS